MSEIVDISKLPIDVVKMDEPLLEVIITTDFIIKFETAACQADKHKEERQPRDQEDWHMESIYQHHVGKHGNSSWHICCLLFRLVLAQTNIGIDQESYLHNPLNDCLDLVQLVTADEVDISVVALKDVDAVIDTQPTSVVLDLASKAHVDYQVVEKELVDAEHHWDYHEDRPESICRDRLVCYQVVLLLHHHIDLLDA